MKVVIVTGGIATGKSTFCRAFLDGLPHSRLFDCDQVVHRLLTTERIRDRVVEALGEGVLDTGGTQLDRRRIRDLVFGNRDSRTRLERILHPEVRSQCRLALQEAQAGEVDAFLIDVPLFYESGFPIDHDLELVVATSYNLQRERLRKRSALSEDLLDRILAAQMPIGEKVDRADAVIWNGGCERALEGQTRFFIKWLKTTKTKATMMDKA